MPKDLDRHDGHLGIHTLRPGVYLQPLLCHLCVLQELHWHPYQMTPDLVEFRAHVLRGHELIEDVSGFDTARREIPVIVVKGFD